MQGERGEKGDPGLDGYVGLPGSRGILCADLEKGKSQTYATQKLNLKTKMNSCKSQWIYQRRIKDLDATRWKQKFIVWSQLGLAVL